MYEVYPFSKKESALLDTFLEELSEHYSNDGCNDWEFPDNWTQDEKKAFVREYHARNGDPHEYNPNFLVMQNFMALWLLQERIRTIELGREYELKVTAKDSEWLKNYIDDQEFYEELVELFDHYKELIIIFWQGDSDITVEAQDGPSEDDRFCVTQFYS